MHYRKTINIDIKRKKKYPIIPTFRVTANNILHLCPSSLYVYVDAKHQYI